MVEFKDLEFGKREIIGEVVDGHFDLKDAIDPKTGKSAKSNQMHFIIRVVEPEGWKNQNLWIGESYSTESTMYEFTRQLRKLGVISDKDIEEAKDARALQVRMMAGFKDKKVVFKEKRYGRATKENWYPEKLA